MGTMKALHPEPLPPPALEEAIPALLAIQYTLETPVERIEPGDFTLRIHGSIGIGGEGLGDFTEIGTLHATKIRLVDALEEGFNAWDAIDGPSRMTADCLALFGLSLDNMNDDCERPELTPEAAKALHNPSVIETILLLERMEIKEEYRKRDAGLFAALSVIRSFADCHTLVVCKPFPLQFCGDVNTANTKEFKQAKAKLRRYLKRMGFHPIPGTNLSALHMENRMPTF